MLNTILQTSAIHGISKEAKLLQQRRDFVGSFFGTEFTDEMQEVSRGNISSAGFLVVDFFGLGSF